MSTAVSTRSVAKLALMTCLGSSTLVDVEALPIICSWDGKVPSNPLSWLNDARTTWLGSSTYTHRTDGGEGTLSGADTVSAPIRTIHWTWVDSSCPRETLMPGLPWVSPRRLPLWRSALSHALPFSWRFSWSLWLWLTSLLPCLCPLGRSCLLLPRFWLGYGRYLARSHCSRRSWRRLSASEVILPATGPTTSVLITWTCVIHDYCQALTVSSKPRVSFYLTAPVHLSNKNRHPAHHSHTISYIGLVTLWCYMWWLDWRNRAGLTTLRPGLVFWTSWNNWLRPQSSFSTIQ